MSQFLNVIRKEFGMSSRRISLRIVFLALLILYGVMEIIPFLDGTSEVISADLNWQYAAKTVFNLNVFFPLVGGILAADRLKRDYRLGVNELQVSTPIKRSVGLLGKYFGILASMLLPEFICIIVVALIPILGGNANWAYLSAILVSALVICIPSMMFVIAFSLACPMVMPVRVYQVLFTGYWFWGNYLSDKVFPTISGTILNVSGTYVMEGFFFAEFVHTGEAYTPMQAVLNLVVIFILAAAALAVLDRILANRIKKS